MRNFSIIRIAGLASALCLSVSLMAQDANPQIQQLQKQLQAAQENFERLMREQRQVIDQLRQQVDALQKQQSSVTNEPQKLKEAIVQVSLGAGGDSNAPAVKLTADKKWSPADPIRLQTGKSYMDIGLVGTMAVGASTDETIEGTTQLGGHDPKQRGFTLQGLEANLAGVVDSYFRANANILFAVDSAGATVVELEEAYAETLALPGNLQLRAGQFLTEFGRNNPSHPHAWAFVDSPLVNGRLLGPDGMRGLGARLSWLMPVDFYSEMFITLQNNRGETSFSYRNDHDAGLYLGRQHGIERIKTLQDMLIIPRYAASFDLTDQQTLNVGASAAFGHNASGQRKQTQTYGADIYWKWRPTNQQGGFPFVALQSEAMLRRYQAGEFSNDFDGDGLLGATEDVFGDGTLRLAPGETLTDYGFYTQLTWGFQKGWVAGLRGDWLTAREASYEKLYGRDPDRVNRWRISPNLTWYPTEFSKLRLQYNLDERETFGLDHSVWLQLEFLLGAHASHKF